MDDSEQHLSRSLGPVVLWGLGVGYVISGMYFGWNLGLPLGGTIGFAIALFFISLMYIAFTFGYCELACAIPKAGGAFDYVTRAMGPQWGFITGLAQLIEFVFAPPAIAAGIGAYTNLFFPGLNPLIIAFIAYLLFTLINMYGVKLAASFEFIFTLIAVLELIIFVGLLLPHVQYKNLLNNPLPHGYSGLLAALPFAIWFFLGIEGVANMAEESRNPQRTVLLGFGSAMFTIVLLSTFTFLVSVGVGGWEKIVYIPKTLLPSNSPLPLALSQVISEQHFLYRMLVCIGLVGLIASFHGLILAGSRATYEMGRVGYMPIFLGNISKKFHTPVSALFVNMLIGLCALLTGKTSDLITIACFGALSLYILSMIALIKLRKSCADLPRPFRVPFYPVTPLIALSIASCAMLVMVLNNMKLALIYFVIQSMAILAFKYVMLGKATLTYEGQS